MAINGISNQCATDMMQAVADLVNAGAAGGKLVFLTAGDAVLATCTFNVTMEASITNGVLTNNVIVDDSSAAGTGAATKFRVEDDAAASVFLGSVTSTSGGGDIEMSPNNTITATDIVHVNDSGTFTMSTA